MDDQQKTCPVCEHAGTPVGSEVCSQCGADLLLHDLLDQWDDIDRPSLWRTRMLWSVPAFLLAIVIFGILDAAFAPPEAGPALEPVATVDSLRNRIQTLEARVRVLDAANREPRYFHYTVRPGESLRSISAKFFESEARYVDILKANSSSISDPSLIFTGQVIQVPITAGPS